MLLGDSQFLAVFQPRQFSADYLDNTAQFDLGFHYLFERGQKRQHRLQAAKDVTAMTWFQMTDNERSLRFNVASLFINVELAESTLALANQGLKSFQEAVDISEERYKAGDTGEDDLLKMKLQMLQLQMDVSAAQLSRVQALSDLRQLLGYESVGPDYDVTGSFDYQAVKGNLDDFQAKSLANRPDLQASGWESTPRIANLPLKQFIGKRDVTGQVSYTHLGYPTTSHSSGKSNCRSSTVTKARLRAPALPSRKHRSWRGLRADRF